MRISRLLWTAALYASACTGSIDAGDTQPGASGGASAAGGPGGGRGSNTGTGAATTPGSGAAGALPGAIPPAQGMSAPPGSMPPAGNGGLVAPPAGNCTSTPAPARIWRLTRAQYNNTVARLVPNGGRPADAFIPDSFNSGFTNNAAALATPRLLAEQMLGGSRDIAARIALAAPQRAACMTTMGTDPGCVQQFVDRIGLDLFRRPLDAGERTQYVDFFTSKRAELGNDTLAAMIHGMLMSPYFLFRSELGDPAAPAGKVTLTQYEIAALLSYSLQESPPDAELMMLAQQGKLTDRAVREQQAVRLLNWSSNAPAVMAGFFRELLRLDQVIDRPKSLQLFKSWNAVTAAATVAETERFVREALWNDDGRLATVLSANYSFVNQSVAELYGIASVRGTALQRTMLPATQRLGVLTHPSVMAGFATDEEGELVQRGQFVREKLLCQHVPEPPANVNAAFPPRNPALTHRQRFAQHAADPTCVGCHRVLDPVGAAFENYDAIGRFTAMDGGRPVDASGVVYGMPGGGDLAFTGPIDFVQKLAVNPDVHDCVVKQMFRYLLGRDEQAGDACLLGRAKGTFTATRGHVLQMAASLASADDFVARTK